MKRVLMVGLLSAAVILAFGRTNHVYAASVDAIAVDDDQDTKGGNAGFGTGEGDTAKEAQKMALENCRKSGNKGCEVALTYKQCGAYASSKKHAGTGTGSSESAAKKAAMEDCGNDACKIVVSDCVGK
jgi:hypothetical protein